MGQLTIHVIRFIYSCKIVFSAICYSGKLILHSTIRFRSLNHRRLVVAEALESDERFSDIKACIDANETLRDDVMKRTTAVQTVVLEEVMTSSDGRKRGFVIGNTHLYFRPDADHIRLIQIAVCLRQLEQVKQ